MRTTFTLSSAIPINQFHFRFRATLAACGTCLLYHTRPVWAELVATISQAAQDDVLQRWPAFKRTWRHQHHHNHHNRKQLVSHVIENTGQRKRYIIYKQEQEDDIVKSENHHGELGQRDKDTEISSSRSRLQTTVSVVSRLYCLSG